MRIVFCINSLNRFGGGQKVALTLIDELLRMGHEITIYTLEQPRVSEIIKFYGINLKNINFVNLFPSFLKRFKEIYYRFYYGDYILSKRLSKLKGFDIIIDTSSNGFHPISNKEAKTFCYVHFPMSVKPTSTFWKLYLFPIYNKIGYSYEKYDKIIANSYFTKEYIEKIASNVKEIEVIHPPVSTKYSGKDAEKLAEEKENSILTVGRFAPEKKLCFLIEQFKKMHSFNKNWVMDIVGTSSIYHKGYYEKMKKISKGYPISIHEKISIEKVDGLYRKAKIYWHAKGYGETNPIMFEHFGITTVEAMNHGCIPIVINKGGQREIVDHKINGFRWDTKDELYTYTRKVMNEEVEVEAMMKASIEKSREFDESVFRRKIITWIEEMT